MVIIARELTERNGASRRLIVFAHGMDKTPASLMHIRAIAREAYPDADHYAPQLPLKLIRFGDAAKIVAALLDAVDGLVGARDDAAYEEIILVGHSAGAIVARALWCAAHGARADGTIWAADARPWAVRISRLVLLAAVNRGFSTNTAMSLRLRLLFWVGALIEMVSGPNWTMLGFRRGAPFLTTVRLQTLELNRLIAAPPIVVQVLGTVDDFVSPSDNVDLLAGAGFFYLTAPETGHATILDADAATPERAARRDVIRAALKAKRECLRDIAETAADLQDLYQDALEDFDEPGGEVRADRRPERVDQVVFVIHGIRDYGFWTKKLAARIKRDARARGLSCRSVTSTYGFFPMGPFLMPPARRRKMEWLLDQYVHARALYPDALFSCVAHSNGTYLVAAAIACCEAVRFERVAFAGSVVRRDYDWDGAIGRGQVGQAVNYCATGDWVVAVFPKFFQALRYFGLGSAGHDGFGGGGKALPKGLTQVEYIEGAHGAAVREAHWPELATFILDGVRRPDARAPKRHAPFVGIVGRVPWLVLALILVAFVLLPLQLILAPLGARLFGPWSPVYRLPPGLLWLSAVALVGYAWVARKVLTRL